MSELSYVEEKERWQEQINQLKKQHEFSVSICQTLMQDQQVDTKSSYFAILTLLFIFSPLCSSKFWVW